jgi:antitoxin YefM
MNAIKPSQDVIPLSEFRAHVAEYLRQAQETGRPVVITQHGRGTGVLLSSDEYERILDTQELLRAVSRSQAQLAAGKGIPHEEAVASFRATIRKLKKQHASRQPKPSKAAKKKAKA